ncbi:MAG TPA: hypothetical protein VFE46_06410 [Pirellulales bacterium]|jgi:hypothetical protein|nr:hypothetical protein [Pirellulales bacterium]
MSIHVASQIVVDGSAIEYAFRMGQTIERLLLEQSIKECEESGSSLVTKDHVKSCLNWSLFERLIAESECVNGGICSTKRTGNRESREAA